MCTGKSVLAIGMGGVVEGAVDRRLRGEKITLTNMAVDFRGICIDRRDVR